jgi:hypothetical protein
MSVPSGQARSPWERHQIRLSVRLAACRKAMQPFQIISEGTWLDRSHVAYNGVSTLCSGGLCPLRLCDTKMVRERAAGFGGGGGGEGAPSPRRFLVRGAMSPSPAGQGLRSSDALASQRTAVGGDTDVRAHANMPVSGYFWLLRAMLADNHVFCAGNYVGVSPRCMQRSDHRFQGMHQATQCVEHRLYMIAPGLIGPAKMQVTGTRAYKLAQAARPSCARTLAQATWSYSAARTGPSWDQ